MNEREHRQADFRAWVASLNAQRDRANVTRKRYRIIEKDGLMSMEDCWPAR